jgi:hypothetical protein
MWLFNAHLDRALYSFEMLLEVPAVLAEGVRAGLPSLPTSPFHGSLLYAGHCLMMDWSVNLVRE